MDLINWSLNATDTIFSTRSLGSGEPDCPAGTFAAGYTMDAWERWRVVCLAALSVEDIEDIYLFGTMITGLLLIGFSLVYRENRKTVAVQNLTRLPVMIEAVGRALCKLECGYSPQDQTIPILSAFGSHQPALASAKAAVGTTTPPEEHCSETLLCSSPQSHSHLLIVDYVWDLIKVVSMATCSVYRFNNPAD
ncbi:hypothetical protein DPX16_1803 [Anabarilius grahami]|uniref:Uncharacterized protein n=1 Tax=Anabarilius grahami TaxID=495550 RepID=A0A3N0YG29_ANAGA|nr:hypothetical protein DPX16_1803 [Anabarilius grahami]